MGVGSSDDRNRNDSIEGGEAVAGDAAPVDAVAIEDTVCLLYTSDAADE